MKEKRYKVKIENGEIKLLDEIDLSNIKEGIVIFLDLDDPVKANQVSSADSLLKYAGAWTGNDFEECLKDVYNARGEAEF